MSIETDEGRGAFKRVVILGCSGFLGRWIVDALRRERKDVATVGFSSAALDLTRGIPDAGALDGLLDRDTILVVLAGVKRHADGDSRRLLFHNTAIMEGVCRIIENTPPGRVVYFSSAAVYGEDVARGVIDERTPPCCRSYYGLSKLTGEIMLEKTLTGLPTSLGVLRPPTIYGPGDHTPTYGPSAFLRDAKTAGRVVLWGDGREMREFVYVEDVADFTIRYMFSDHQGPLNLVSGVSRNFREALNAVEAALGRPITRSSRPRSRDPVDLRFDGGALRRLAPDFRFTDLMEGVKRMTERIEAEGWETCR